MKKRMKGTLKALAVSQSLFTARLLYITALIIYPIIGVLYNIFLEDIQDPVIHRVLFSSIVFVFFLLSFFNEEVRKNISNISLILFYILTVHTYYLCYTNSLNSAFTLGTDMIILAGGVIINNLRSWLLYAVFNVISILLIYFLLIDPPFAAMVVFYITVIVSLILTAVIIMVRIDLSSKIADYQKELEKNIELLHSNNFQLERANQELNQFSSVVSHDLKSPLRGVNSLMEIFSLDYNEKLDSGAMELIGVVKQRLKKMEAMIEGILEYHKMGTEDSENLPVDLNTQLVSIVELLSPPKHIKIKIQKNLPIVMGNHIKYQQVFQNLISNAIKFNDKKEGVIEVKYRLEENQHIFSVIDNGPGIDEKYQDRIFNIFQTLHTSDFENSTGVGLSIVKRIVESYEGKIKLSSEVGKGTEFYFTISDRFVQKSLID